MTDVASAEPSCPQCHAPIGALPFCPRDGRISGADRFVIGERYVVEKLLGGGGFAFVYAARHLVLGKPVAIKVLRGDAGEGSLVAKRFLREARNASQLSHENIISILDFGHDTTHDIAYLVMELFTGESLAQVIQTSAPIPASRAMPILVQLARALASSHAAGVAHRDVTPRNVLVGRGDLVKLCDFGLSRSFQIDDRVTNAGAVVGTPAYMAPEQLRGEDPVGHAADIFGLGCIAYEMLTGQIPHHGGTPVEMMVNRLGDRTIDGLDRLDIAPELADLVGSCLASDPEQRPSAAEIESRLLAISAASGPERKLAELSGDTIGSYRIVRLLGKGGVSTVYLGTHPVIDTKVAIKVIAPHVASITGMAERFAQEARASSELNSPHIPRYFDFGFLKTGQPYAVMEYFEGETLGKLIAREGRLSIERAAILLRQIATAMSVVHAAGLVHRDLKPDNLFLTRSPDGGVLVKILDFGIAKALAPGSSPAQTSLGMMLGTPHYCAPEQAMGLAVSPAADVYALGATAFEMLAGKPPFGGTVAEVLGAKTTTEAPGLQGLPREVTATIARMLARNPDARMASMSDVVAALDHWQEPDTTATPKFDFGHRRWWLVAAAAAVVLAVIVVIATRSRGTSREAEPEAPAMTVTPIPAEAPAQPPAPPAQEPVARPPVAEPPPVVEPPPSGVVHAPAPARPVHPAGKQRPHAAGSAAPRKTDDGVIVDPFQETP